MTMVAQATFWSCLALVLYVYIGYPFLAVIFASLRPRLIQKLDIFPQVTVVVAAFNEEDEIEETVRNKLDQDYPPELLDVIVVSDGSTDRTDEIVSNLSKSSHGRAHLLRQDPRQGKTQALNAAMSRAEGDIVIFSDANSLYAPNAVRMLVRNFADPYVGYVTGSMVYISDKALGIGDGSARYMSYENSLRLIESKLGSVVGVDGGIDAIRRELYVKMKADQLPDFVLPLCVVEQGKRVVYEPKALVFETALGTPVDEFRMRIRVALRAMWAMYDKRQLLNPLRYRLFSWQLFSHKLLRYLTFFALVGLFLANGILVGTGELVFTFILALQLAFYGAAVVGHFFARSVSMRIFLIPYYFAILNVASAVAFWKFVKGEKMVVWKPRSGVGA